MDKLHRCQCQKFRLPLFSFGFIVMAAIKAQAGPRPMWLSGVLIIEKNQSKVIEIQ